MSERDKISFSELDRRRREKRNGGGGGGERRPRSEQGRRRSRAAVAAFKRRVEEEIFGRKNDGRARLADRLRQAHETPNFLRTYREYVKSFGVPEDLRLLMLCLDLEDEREVLRVVDALGDAAEKASHDEKNLLRSRLRNLEMSASSDALGEAAAEVLSRL